MSMQSTVLGRGLSSLIPSKPSNQGDGAPLFINISEIEAHPDQPRRQFDEQSLMQLARSIREQGILQPLLVSKRDDGGYRVIAGERRMRAAILAQLTQVPVVVRTIAPSEAFELALIENIQREDLNPIEEAQAYRRLLDEYSYTQAELAERVGKDRTTVTNALRLLKLRDPLRDQLLRGAMSAGHARALLGTDDAGLQDRIAERIESEGLSVRTVEQLVSGIRKKAAKKKQPAAGRAYTEQREMGQRFGQHLGRNVQVRPSNRGGKLVLTYSGSEDLRGLLTRLGMSD